MAADQDVSVSVDLEQISVKGVEPETANGEGVIVLEVLMKKKKSISLEFLNKNPIKKNTQRRLSHEVYTILIIVGKTVYN